MAKKKDKNRRIKDMLKHIRESQDQVFNMQDPTTRWIPRPDLQQKILYLSNFEDNFVRSCMWPVFEMEGIDISEVSDAELAQILVENDIWNEGQLASFVIDYLHNKEECNNVERD